MNLLKAPIAVVLLCAAVGCAGPQPAPAPEPAPAPAGEASKPDDKTAFAIVKLDPALDAIVSPDARLETVGDRFGLTEGPLWIRDGTGYLLVSDLIATSSTSGRRAVELTAFLENIYDGPDILNVGQQTRRGRLNVIIIGANGLTLDREGRLVIASPASRAVKRLEKDGKVVDRGGPLRGQEVQRPERRHREIERLDLLHRRELRPAPGRPPARCARFR